MATAAAGVMSHARAQPVSADFDPGRDAVAFTLVAAGLCAAAIFMGTGLALLLTVPVLAVWFWRAPVRGVYVLVAGAALIEIFPLHFSDSLTDRVLLFLNLNNTAGFDFPITPAEILMLTACGAALGRGVSERRVRWPEGRIVTAYVVYVLVVVSGELHGLVSGGDLKTSLWEIRPQIYGFVVFILATTQIQDRTQLKRLALFFLLAVFAKALIGDFRYYVTLKGDLGGGFEVLAHEDSYFLGLFVTAGLAGLIWLKNRRFAVLMSLGSGLALLAMLANSRRAGVYALAGAIAVVVLLAHPFEPSLRKRIAWLSVLTLIAGIGFIGYAWNKEYGVQAQLVRPIRSVFDPSARDFSSDIYRTAETANIRFTFRTSPIIGVGFGSPFYIVYPMADISNIYPFWNVIPHNSLLWVGMRMGTVGFIAFWGLIGFGVLAGFDIMRTRRDPLTRAVVAFALAAIAAEIAVGYTDLQLESDRNLIFVGAVLGVLNMMPRLQEASDV